MNKFSVPVSGMMSFKGKITFRQIKKAKQTDVMLV